MPKNHKHSKMPLRKANTPRGEQYTQANIQGFLNVVLKLQHHGHHDAALDLTREAFAAADQRAYLYRLDSRRKSE